MTERIPSYITHPAGSEVEMLVDDTHAVMSRAAFADLGEYSCTIPTGAYVGKRWRRDNNAFVRGAEPEWLLGEYVKDPDPKVVGIKWRRILLLIDPA